MIRVLLLSLLLGLSTVLTVHAQEGSTADYRDVPGLPDDPKAARIEALVAAINANDAAAVRRFMESHVAEGFRTFAPMEVHEQAFLGTYRSTQGVDVYGIRHYTPPREDDTVVILRDRLYGTWHGLILQFEDAGTHRISGISFSRARPPETDTPALTEAALVEAVRAAVRRGCEADVFSGALLLARGDEVLVETACGEASKRFHVPNDVETKFNMGSMNKMFTAVAAAQLAERRKLSYDDPISRYVDETWLPRAVTDQVTVRHLLTHTSGLGSYFNETFERTARARLRGIDDYKPLVRDDTLAFTPGARFRYSNTGMLLLGVVVERASGQDYFDYVREHVFGPAGMAHTDSYAMDEPVENLAIGYIPAPERPTGWRNNLFAHVIKGGPAGGGFSTVGDLHRFARALQKGTLVSDETLTRMWTDAVGAGYGYGFQVQKGPAGPIVGHGGGFPGLNGQLDVYRDSGYVVVVLSNYDQGAGPLARHVEHLVGRVAAP